jgi:hypothetical protein
VFEAITALLVACWVAGGGVDRLDATLGIGAIALALWSQQFVPLFAVVAAPQLGTYARSTWERAIAPRLAGVRLARLPRRLSALARLRGARAAPLDVRVRQFGIGVPLVAIAVAVVVVAWHQAGFSASAAAESAQEPRAAATRVAASFAGQRIYAPVTWGDYLTYRFSTSRVVFVYPSGGSFSDDTVEQYRAIHLLQPSWEAVLRQTRVQVAIVGDRSQEASALHELGWRVECADATASALVMAAPAAGAPTIASGPLTIPPSSVPAC